MITLKDHLRKEEETWLSLGENISVQNFWEDQNMCASKQAKGASAV
jgi:hypothetical protein